MAAPIIPSPARPPTTPPAIAPAFVPDSAFLDTLDAVSDSDGVEDTVVTSVAVLCDEVGVAGDSVPLSDADVDCSDGDDRDLSRACSFVRVRPEAEFESEFEFELEGTYFPVPVYTV